jgi:hypothetical protein
MRKHRKIATKDFAEALDTEENLAMTSTKRQAVTVKPEGSILKFVQCAVQFPTAYLRWMCATYQPINMCENEYFRAMIEACNPKIKPLGRSKVKEDLFKKRVTLEQALRKSLKGKKVTFHFSPASSTFITVVLLIGCNCS